MNSQNLLHALVGEWSGKGRGEFPTIKPFEFQEVIRFSADDRPFLHYEQKTKRRSNGQIDFVPSHWESGFIRLLPDGKAELINVQSSGRLERLTGSMDRTGAGLILRLKSSAFLNDTRMIETSRMITLEKDVLHYTQTMYTTAVTQSAQHIDAILHRTT